MLLAPVPHQPSNNEVHTTAYQTLKSSGILYNGSPAEESSWSLKDSLIYSDGGGELKSSVRYPELYSTNSYLKYPELYSPSHFQLGPDQYELDYLPMFPVDTPNIIPDHRNNFKQQYVSPIKEPESVATADPLDDFDLASLLVPTNHDEACFSADGFLSESTMLDLDLINLEASLPDEINHWHGLEKDASYQQDVVTSGPANAQTHSSQRNSDSAESEMCMSISRTAEIGQAATPMDISSSEVEENCNITDCASSTTESWDQNLQTLFEKMFEFPDLKNNSASATAEIASADHESTPPRDEVLKIEKVDDHDYKPEGAAKPTLLFGRDEGEIIHKLISIKRGARSKPITRKKLISMPVEEFNVLLEHAQLSEIEVAFMKEWRRRGKNKAAAQIARKRKREEVSDLDLEVRNIRQQKKELEKRHSELQSLVKSLKDKNKEAEDKFFQWQSLLGGQAVSHETHHIYITEEDELVLIPRANANKIVVAKTDKHTS